MARDEGQPNWLPLQQHIGERCEEWMWMYRDRGLEFYKHRHTRQYLVLDAEGVAWRIRQDGSLVPGDFEKEYRRTTSGYSTEHGVGTTLLDQVKALAKELNVDQPPEYFDGLSETTLGYLLVGMRHIESERTAQTKGHRQ